MMKTTQQTLKSIEEYLTGKADSGEELAKSLRDSLLPLLNPRTILTEMQLEGYAIVVFSPEEIGTATAKSVENRLVELGNEVISDLQESHPTENQKG